MVEVSRRGKRKGLGVSLHVHGGFRHTNQYPAYVYTTPPTFPSSDTNINFYSSTILYIIEGAATGRILDRTLHNVY